MRKFDFLKKSTFFKVFLLIFLTIFCSGAIYSAKIALFRSKQISDPNFAKIGFFEKIGIFQGIFIDFFENLLLRCYLFCENGTFSLKKNFFGSEFCENLIFRKNRHKTGPNHQYCDLEAEKLVYKLLILVLDDRVSF